MTSDRHDPDATPELSDEFWGEQTEWTQRAEPSSERPGLGAAIGRWWGGLGGGVDGGGRVHGEPRIRSHHDDRAPLAEPVIDDDTWDLEPEPQPVRQSGVDPLIARIGGLAVVLALAAPLVLGITASGSDSGDAMLATISGAPSSETAATSTLTEPTTTPAGSAVSSSAAADAESTTTSSSDAGVVETQTEPSTLAASPQIAALEASPDTEATTTEPPATTTTVAACGRNYELAAGDYWIRIADAAGVSLADLLGVNGASVDTVLVPGRSICLPAGASTPAPPTTAATARPAPAATAPANNSSTRTRTTTAPAPTTTAAPPRPSAVPESEATAIIREIWPDELEEKALQIAWRESNHRSNASNFCCYGLFQIYFSVHRSWLANLGINSAQDLYDPRANTIAAYTLYQRAGGWGPWGG